MHSKIFLPIILILFQSMNPLNLEISDPTDQILCFTDNKKLMKCDGKFTDKITSIAKYSEEEGWHIFYVETNDKFSNEDQSFAAGFLEGYIYADYFDYHYTNIKNTIFRGEMKFSDEAMSYIKSQKKYVESLYSDPKSDYDEMLKYITLQIKGMYEGYKTKKSNHTNDFDVLTEDDVYYLSYFGDLSDVDSAFPLHTDDKKGYFLHENNKKECTIYAKYFQDGEKKDFYVAHNTHNAYSMMNRVYKHYNIKITTKHSGRKINEMKFTSRPGDMNSKDDFYMTSSKMVITETSLNVINKEIYKYLSPETVPKFMRAVISNELSYNCSEWIFNFFKHNSGTHNNQWLIFDYKELDKIKGSNYELIPDNKNGKTIVKYDNGTNCYIYLCYILEQTPNIKRRYMKDMTGDFLSNTYVGSYNAPYFTEVRDELGVKEEGDYWHAKRYFVIKDLDKNIKDLDGVKYLIDYHDKDNLCDQIGARCDVGTDNPFGAIDAKITNLDLIKEMKANIRYGPPVIEGVSYPFKFGEKYKNYSHYGITEEEMKFKWIVK